MKVIFSDTIKALKGTYKTTDLVFSTRGGITIAYGKTRWRPRRTAEKQKSESKFGSVAVLWGTLSGAQRDTWHQYAQRYFHSDIHTAAFINGFHAFCKCG